MSEGTVFGAWLKQRRSELGVTQEALAERIFCSLATLQKIEGGNRRPSGQIANLLADFLDIKADERNAFMLFARSGQVISADSSSPTRVSHAPWRLISLQHTNLPVVLTTLIGREKEEEEAHSMLLNPKIRLLSMTGPPGVGKTRLALQIASNLAGYFEDGVFFVDLSAVEEPSLVLFTVARTLDLQETGDLSAESLLLSFVRERRLLLVLDNFEQVLDAANDLVKLLQASPWLKVLVTSREALHVRGERRLLVRPLKVPELSAYKEQKQQVPPGELALLAALPSVELFVERAQAASPDFILSQENVLDVARICVALEGLPLAIELTAARAGHHSLNAMRAALANKNELATHIGDRDVPPRQRTLKSAFEWSYGLLDANEQKLFRRLSVFVQGYTLEAADAVCNFDDVLASNISEAMASLVDKSLLQRSVTVDTEDEQRFRMLDTMRRYAESKLRLGDGPHAARMSQEADETERAHALYFMRLAEESISHIRGVAEGKWLIRLENEHANLQAAIRWAQQAASTEEAGENSDEATEYDGLEIWLRLVAALGPFWYIRGYLAEGREELATVLAATEPLAAAPLEESLQKFRAAALQGIGIIAGEQGDYASAKSMLRASLNMRRGYDDKEGIASLANNLGSISFLQGDLEEAFAFFSESLALCRESGNDIGTARALNNLGCIAYDQERLAEAYTFHSEALAIKRALGDVSGVSMSLSNLANLAGKQGDYAEARALYTESITLKRESGFRLGIGLALTGLADVAQMQGSYEEAATLYVESIILREEVGEKPGVCFSLISLGKVVIVMGDAQLGTKLMSAAAATLDALGASHTPDTRAMMDEGIALGRERLGEDVFARAWAEGRSMSREQAIELARNV